MRKKSLALSFLAVLLAAGCAAAPSLSETSPDSSFFADSVQKDSLWTKEDLDIRFTEKEQEALVYPYPIDPIPADHVPTLKDFYEGWILTPELAALRKEAADKQIEKSIHKVDSYVDFDIRYYAQPEENRYIEINALRPATAAETAEAAYTPEECLQIFAEYKGNRNYNSKVTKVSNMLYRKPNGGGHFEGPAYVIDRFDTKLFVLNENAAADLVNGRVMVKIYRTSYDPYIDKLEMAAQFTKHMYEDTFEGFPSKIYYMDANTGEIYVYRSKLQYLEYYETVPMEEGYQKEITQDWKEEIEKSASATSLRKGDIPINQGWRLATAAEERNAKYSSEECLEIVAKYWRIERLHLAYRRTTKTDMLYANADGSLYTGSAYIADLGEGVVQVFMLNKYGRAELISGKTMLRIHVSYVEPETEELQKAALYAQDQMYWDSVHSFFIDLETMDLYEYYRGVFSKEKRWDGDSLIFRNI